MPYIKKETLYEIEGTEREIPVTVGIEIETELENIRFRLHEDLGCGFSGWWAGTDCSVNHGSEVKSPILQGVGGLAEIIGTAEILVEETAFMQTNCGQHTTIGDPRVEARNRHINWNRRMKNLFIALEEGLYAFTGDPGRMFRGYGNAYKPNAGDGFRNRDGAVVEMRYPPGTLDRNQIAVNVGVCQMLGMLAFDMRLNESRELREAALSLHRESGVTGRQISSGNLDFALSFLREQGWSEGGAFPGLPYDIDTPTKVTLKDASKGEYEVAMPVRSEIEEHIERMMTQFHLNGHVV